ncbi:hypothetical protein F5883DRAFT_610237 [Diaporthe sp. PMI_573]|nr:hypothetical protein F5883DRAFT_610237 [Diaporthaceae sp. PMI_573]
MSPTRLSSKRDGGLIGSDLIITYCSDFVGCEILPSGRRYTHNANLKAGTFLAFPEPLDLLETYDSILSSRDDEDNGIQLLLSAFSLEAKPESLGSDWEGQWFVVTARICPNILTFEGIEQDSWGEESSKPVQYALALPRDQGIEPISPRQLSNHPNDRAWPTRPAQTSFAGPVDHERFQLRTDIWTELQRRTSVFVKLGSYINTEEDRPPHKGVHVCHVLLPFPVHRQPWSAALSWMQNSQTPFPAASWISCTGRILGRCFCEKTNRRQRAADTSEHP